MELEVFKAEHGHAWVRESNQPSKGFADWQQKQRSLRRKGRLDPERQARLDALGFDWKPTGQGEFCIDEKTKVLWEERFSELLKFRMQHGHCKVTDGWMDNPSLANWVGKQRAAFRAGRMLAVRRQRLEEIGFLWCAEGLDSQANWDKRYAALVAFQQTHGHLRVPDRKPDSHSLNKWLGDQRLFQRRGKLNQERKARLDALGIDWEPSGHVRPVKQDGLPKDSLSLWEHYFAKLAAFKAQYGHAHVPSPWPEDRALSAWVREQRSGRVYGRLHYDQLARLEQLGFAWKVVRSAG